MEQAKSVICQIVVSDSFDDAQRPCVSVEMRSSDPSQKESMANVMTAWLAQNWDELFTLFRRQLKAYEQERAGVADVVKTVSGGRLVNADGKSFTSTDNEAAFANAQMQLLLPDGTPLVGTAYDAPAIDVTSDAPAPSYSAPVITESVYCAPPAPAPSYDYSSPASSSWSDSSSSSSCDSSSTFSSSDFGG